MLCKVPFNGFPCGQCIPCRINLRRVKASRIMFEAAYYDAKSFLTLTYDDEHVPHHGNSYTLRPDDLTDFWKRLRYYHPPRSLYYYACGEYGHEGSRQWNPHYHAALFGLQCLGKQQRPDTYPRCYCANCEHVRQVWGHGNITLDELSETSAGYICGYVLKKLTAADDYRLEGRYPEFCRSSNGIGKRAALDIAEALKGEYGALAMPFSDVPFNYLRGNSAAPLGRYMREKMRQSLGLEKINPATGEVTHGTPLQAVEKIRRKLEKEMCDVQDAIKTAPHGEKAPLYEKLDSMRRKKDSRRKVRVLQVETRHKIFSSKSEKKL